MACGGTYDCSGHIHAANFYRIVTRHAYPHGDSYRDKWYIKCNGYIEFIRQSTRIRESNFLSKNVTGVRLSMGIFMSVGEIGKGSIKATKALIKLGFVKLEEK